MDTFILFWVPGYQRLLEITRDYWRFPESNLLPMSRINYWTFWCRIYCMNVLNLKLKNFVWTNCTYIWIGNCKMDQLQYVCCMHVHAKPVQLLAQGMTLCTESLAELSLLRVPLSTATSTPIVTYSLTVPQRRTSKLATVDCSCSSLHMYMQDSQWPWSF